MSYCPQYTFHKIAIADLVFGVVTMTEVQTTDNFGLKTIGFYIDSVEDAMMSLFMTFQICFQISNKCLLPTSF